MSEPRERMAEIRKQIEALNIEAEKILLEHANDPQPTGRGECKWNWATCSCGKYVHGDEPGICGRSHCGHPASYHEF